MIYVAHIKYYLNDYYNWVDKGEEASAALHYAEKAKKELNNRIALSRSVSERVLFSSVKFYFLKIRGSLIKSASKMYIKQSDVIY